MNKRIRKKQLKRALNGLLAAYDERRYQKCEAEDH